MLKIDGEPTSPGSGLPSWWYEEGEPKWPDLLYRYAYKEPQSGDLPHDDAIRVDAVFWQLVFSTPPQQSAEIWGVRGTVICEVEGEPYVPDYTGEAAVGTCPINFGDIEEYNPVYVGS
jgi:hypothetical protein